MIGSFVFMIGFCFINGFCVFMIGSCVFMIGSCVFMIGSCVFMIGSCVFMIGSCVFMIGFCFINGFCALDIAYDTNADHFIVLLVVSTICKSPPSVIINLKLLL